MIPIRRLLYKIQMRLNKVATNTNQNIPDHDIILALNEAQLKLIKQKADLLDGTKRLYEDLEFLIEPFKKLTVTDLEGNYPGVKAPLATDFFLPLDCYCLCNKGGCKDQPVVISKYIKHGDLTTYYNNTHYTPSFEYRDTFAQISNKDILVYTDGIFKVSELHLSYLRYPTKVDIQGYIDLQGIPSTDQDSEFPDHLEDELLNLTALELGIQTENPIIIQTRKEQ